MPSRNIVKEFTAEAYYHVYNRGIEKRDIFQDDTDYIVFLGLLKKYLIGDMSAKASKNRHKHKTFGEQLQLLSYCLMPNHYHLLFYQSQDKAITDFTRRVMTGYVMYFNAKYKRVGPLFQGNYKASQINADAYLQHISRYIHLNPDDFENWPYSSWQYYTGAKSAPWLDTKRVLSMFTGRKEHTEFVHDYQNTKRENDELKWQLANDIEW